MRFPSSEVSRKPRPIQLQAFQSLTVCQNVAIKVELYQESGQHADVLVTLALSAPNFEDSIVEIVQVVRQRRFLYLNCPKVVNSAKTSSDFDGVAGTW